MSELKSIIQDAKVLLIDDDIRNVEVLLASLKKSGYQLSYATSGKKGLAMVKDDPPDIVLLDIAMPVMDGYEVIGILKKEKKWANIPVIFLTAFVGQSSITKGLEAGAVDYITKPFQKRELLSRIKTHLELKKSRDLLEEQNKKLASYLKVNNKLFSIIGHDLRNPFNVVIGSSQYLQESITKLTEEKILSMLLMIEESARDAYTISENLLNWARNRTDKMPYNPEMENLKSIVSEIISTSRSPLKIKKIKVEIDISENLNVYADREMLQIIIRNIFLNAIKFSHEEGKIELKAKQVNENIILNIIDEGTGISGKKLKKIFALENIKSTAGTRGELGTGLGLLLCHDLIEINSGSIKIKSEETKGTVVTISIPKQ